MVCCGSHAFVEREECLENLSASEQQQTQSSRSWNERRNCNRFCGIQCGTERFRAHHQYDLKIRLLLHRA